MQVAKNIQSEIGLLSEIALFQDLSPHHALTLLFSAKEALYKAFYPLVRQFFDFKAVQATHVTESTLTLRLLHELGRTVALWQRICRGRMRSFPITSLRCFAFDNQHCVGATKSENIDVWLLTSS